MTIDLEDTALKIAGFRNRSGQSLEEVSEGTGISSQRLSELERNIAKPTGDEILILADYWKCDFQLLINARIKPLEQIDILYRASEKDFSVADRKAVRDFIYLCETEHFLMQERKFLPDRFFFTPSGAHYKTHGEEGALALRKFLGYETLGKPSQVGMNIYDDIRRIGIHVFRRKLESSRISGLFLLHPTAGPCILVNYDEDIYRQRFTVAHELAHAILDLKKKALVSFKGVRDDLIEMRANRFASCYLMPPRMLEKLKVPDWDEQVVLHWANKFQVSCEALGIALKESKQINEKTFERIRTYKVPFVKKNDPELPRDFSSKDYQRKRFFLERGLSEFYVRLCFDAYHEGIISRGRLAEALLVDAVELMEVASAYGNLIR